VFGKAVKSSYYGGGTGPVWLADVRCRGTEHDIKDCLKSWAGGVNCDHTNDAGVICKRENYNFIIPKTILHLKEQ
jgi:hypothetical protein